MLRSFKVFGFTFYPYSLFMILGAGVCLALFTALTFHRHKDKSDENFFTIEMLIISVAAALPAAMLLDAVFKIRQNGTLKIEGATFYGGLLFALMLFPLLLLLKKKRTVRVYERLCDLAPCIPAGHFFGRVGCFFGGCCYGIPTDSVFGVVFPEGSYAYEFYGGAVAVHPTQLYEAGYLILLFAGLILFAKKSAFPCYLLFYGVGRFAIECFRGDNRGEIFMSSVSPAQWISLVLILLGGFLLVLEEIHDKNDSAPFCPK